jgi:hypothetical protein
MWCGCTDAPSQTPHAAPATHDKHICRLACFAHSKSKHLGVGVRDVSEDTGGGGGVERLSGGKVVR